MRLILFLHLGHRIIGAVLIIYISGFNGQEMNKFMLERKNALIIAFDKPISNRFFLPNIRIENMVYSHPLSLSMKHRFKKFVVKFLCLKFLQDFYFSRVFVVMTESF